MADPNSLIPIDLPLLGLNTIDPFVDWNSGYARELTNNSLYNGRVYMRPAIRKQVYNGGLGANPVHWYDVTSIAAGTYAILADGKIRLLSDGSGAATVGGAPAYHATQCKHSSLNLVIGCREPRLATNPFTAWTITTNTVTATDIRAACSHKGRIYVADGNQIEYSSIDQVTGAMPTGQTFSFAPYLDGQSILRIFSTSISNNGDTTQNVFVVFGSGGRVLVYQGDYPASASWAIMAKFDMPTPVSNVGFLEVNGDIWVSTYYYAYWFRDLFSGGAESAYGNSPTRPIENIWQGIYWSSLVSENYTSHTFYEPKLDAIITQSGLNNSGANNFRLIAEYNNDSLLFVYFRKYKAWAVWFTTHFGTPVLADSSISTATLYGCSPNAEVKVMVHGNSQDQYTNTSTVDIETSWKTPYYKSEGKAHKVNNVLAFFENNSSGYLGGCRTIFDYSDYNAVMGWYTQSNVTQVNPGNYRDSTFDIAAVTWNQYRARMGCDGNGAAFSVQFTQKAKAASGTTQTQSIYGATAYVEEGGELF